MAIILQRRVKIAKHWDTFSTRDITGAPYQQFDKEQVKGLKKEAVSACDEDKKTETRLTKKVCPSKQNAIKRLKANKR